MQLQASRRGSTHRTHKNMVRYFIVALFIQLNVAASLADELSFLAGGLAARDPNDHTYSWAIDYRHALSEHFGISGA